MEISATSFRNLLRNISAAVVVKESAIDYENLLREIFEERGTYDEALVDSEIRSQDEVGTSQIFIGRDNEVEQLLSKLLDSDEKEIQLSVIPILGDRGIGKSSLARMVYNDAAVNKYFEVRAWVRVDGPDFRLHHAAHQILKSAMGMSCSFDDLDELDEMVRDTLLSQRCLIVFDGIEHLAKDSWLHMNKYWFDFVDFGSKVLITTTSKDVAYLVVDQPFKLKQLSQDNSWFLFKYVAFDSSDIIRHISMPVAQNLYFLCRGIPLLLKLVGKLMRYDHKIRDLLSSVDSLDDIVWSAWDASHIILLCIWALPSQLRQCFAYCALFPKGYVLNKEKIIDMWIADGLVKPSPGNNSLEDVGNAYFLQLLYGSFFTDISCTQNSDIIEFHISGLIHEIGEHVARIVYKEKLGLIGSISEDAGRFSLVLLFEEQYQSEHMRTLIFLPTRHLGGSLVRSLLDFQELHSLDLSCSSIQTLLDDICDLRELRYLNLSYTFIEELPDSIMRLSRLETLDLSWCYRLKFLPKGLCELIHMRHLDLCWCDSLSYLPCKIGSLRSLTSMPLFVLGKGDDCARLGELGMLNKLSGRLEIRNLENVREITEAQNAKLDLKNLQHLGLVWSQNTGEHFKVMELLQPHPHLRFLHLTGYMGFRFPRWISSIKSLLKVTITDCGCRKLPSLGQLPFLKELQLNRMMNLECIDQEFYGEGIVDVCFPSLEQLELYDLPRLLEWSDAALLRAYRLSDLPGLFSSGTTVPSASSHIVFRSLKILTIEGCPKIPTLPSLPTLLDLMVNNCNENTLSSLASFTSLSSLLINDMEVWQGVSSGDFIRLKSLKKLILSNIKDERISFHRQGWLTSIEHLGILHCHELTDLYLDLFPSLQKLHIVNCPKLRNFFVRDEEDTQLMELVLEECPRVSSNIYFHKFHYLRKLIVKNCGGDFSIYFTGEFKKLEKLEYLFISQCLKVESELQAFPWLISHIPCIIVGNHKANYKDSNDLREVLTSDSDEPKSEEMEVLIPDLDKPKSEVTEVLISDSDKPKSEAMEVLISDSDKPKSEAMVLSPYSHDLKISTTKQSILHNLRAMTCKEIQKATKNFRHDRLLGKGGFGTVYKGWIDEQSLTSVKPGSGIAVAIKKWRPESHQGHEPWLKEVKYLGQLHHPNLVKLIGYCTEEDSMILVYEFMPKGSLNNHLSARHQSLSWATRIKVAVGAARALSFLHDLEIPVIHRDVKSSNILLDAEFNAKLSDFGIARDGPTGDITHITTQVMGTFGYLAPEYAMTGCLSTKSDVYGFGVVLLELLSGMRVYDTNRPAGEIDLVEWAKLYLGDKRKLLRIMDTRLEGQYTGHEAYTVAKLASQCLSLDPKGRPRMAEVVVALEQIHYPKSF